MALDYGFQPETPPGTVLLTPRMTKSLNATIWFCSWSIYPQPHYSFATVTIKDPFGSRGNNVGGAFGMADQPQNKERRMASLKSRPQSVFLL
jgi:hypothetical protein